MPTVASLIKLAPGQRLDLEANFNGECENVVLVTQNGANQVCNWNSTVPSSYRASFTNNTTDRIETYEIQGLSKQAPEGGFPFVESQPYIVEALCEALSTTIVLGYDDIAGDRDFNDAVVTAKVSL